MLLDCAGMGPTIQRGTITGARSGLAGRFVGTLFFGIFFLAGLLFLFLIGREVLRTVETYSWPKVPAVILSSRVVEEPDEESPYSVGVQYCYTWNGTKQVSDRFQRSRQRFSDYSRAAAAVAAIPAGRETECFVNPHTPEAVLRHGELWIGLFALIPLVFVLIGAGGVYACWAPGKGGKAAPVSDGNKGGGSARWFGLLFVAVGLAVLVFWYLPNTLQGLASFSWVEKPCTVESSRVVEVDSDDGTTYRVDILYRYEFQETQHRSNRYSSFQGSSSGRAAKQAVVSRYRPGSQAVCFVDPSAPQNAVLVRGLGWEAAIGLLPLAFIAVGMGVFLSGRSKKGSAATLLAAAPEDLMDAGSRLLKPRVTPLTRFIGMVFIAAFWNGIVSVFLFHMADEWQRGHQPWFLTLFLVPFVLVGAAFLFGAVYSLLSLANPKPVVILTPGVLTPACAFEVAWSLRGSAGRLQNLVVFLEGREEATYRRGTDTSTDRHVFARFVIATVENPLEIAQGSARRSLPPDIPPGFAADNNKLVWSLRVHGKIAFWPDLGEEFEVQVAAAQGR